MTDRKPDGRFAPGNRAADGHRKGRPPRNYSVAHALSIAADQPQSVDDDGAPLTDAQLAARWLWRIVRHGVDVRRDGDGGEQPLPVSTKDRLAALQTILSRIEPPTSADPADLPDAEPEQVMEQLDGLSDEELQVLEKIGMGRRGTDGSPSPNGANGP